jgi:hypothetical protein
MIHPQVCGSNRKTRNPMGFLQREALLQRKNRVSLLRLFKKAQGAVETPADTEYQAPPGKKIELLAPKNSINSM